MPYIKLQTNKNMDDKQAFLRKISALTASELGKPESYVMTSLEAGIEMTFGGTADPAAFIECKSIGLSSGQTKQLSSALCGFCESELGIAADRIYIEFTGAQGNMWGWKGGTF